MMQSSAPINGDIRRAVAEFPGCGKRSSSVLLTKCKHVEKDGAIVSDVVFELIVSQGLSILWRDPDSCQSRSEVGSSYLFKKSM